MSEKLKVIELFAGVGGFRIGLENTKKFKVVWSNQWEPSTKTQHASMVYENVFGNERKISISRELTKIFEENIRGSIFEVLGLISEKPLKGELVIIVEGFKKSK